MKTLKKLSALLLAIVMLLCLAACHPKDEVAVSSGDIKITSAMYSYYLVMADMEAQNIITSDEKIDTTARGFDFHKQTIEGKPYDEYVKELALNNCLKAIAYQKLCNDNKVELSTDDIAQADYNAQYDWYYYGYNYGYQYGYGDFLPLNGVNFNTYNNVVKINYYGDAYFKHLYDKGGEKEVADTDIQKSMDENYAAVYLLAEQYTDETLETLKTTFTKYMDRINKGEEFKAIHAEHNKTEEDKKEENKTEDSKEETKDETKEEGKTEESTDNKEETKEEPKAKDELISIVGSDKTESNRTFSKFTEVKAMKNDEIKLMDDTENKILYLVVKKDINADTYYKEHLLKSEILYLIKGDEFKGIVDECIKKLDYSVSNYAIKQFKVKNINYGA